MNVIDTFVVQLGLDPKKFTQGQKQALDAMRDLERGAQRSGKNVEAYGQKFDHFITGLKRGILGGLGVFFGGTGAVSILNTVTKTDAALGHLSHTMNQNVRDLSAWRGAARQMGGTGDGIAQTLQSMSGEMNTFLLTGQASFLPLLNRLNISLFNQNGQLKQATDLYGEVADAIHQAYPNDPARRAAMLQLLPGMNQESINLLINGKKALQEYVDAARQAGVTTEASVKAAQEYQRSFSLLETSAIDLSRTLIVTLVPSLVSAMNQMQRFIKNPFGGDNMWNTDVDPDVREGGFVDFAKKWVEGQRGPNANIWGKHGNKEQFMQALTVAWEYFKAGGAPSSYDEGGFADVGKTSASVPKVGMTRADRNNNPGNIEYGDFARRHGATGTDGRFAIFPSREDGFKAAEALLGGRGYRDLTLPQIGARWAEGDPNWARNASRATGIPMDRPLTDDERSRLARTGIPAAEGTKLPGAGGSGSSQTSVTQSTHIGTIVIHTAAKDADGIARDIDPALRRSQLAAPANAGQM